ncbi:hypothetical protein [uncultured Mediterranean phage]|nr:hypothetical protein [uncultured Mediterranean phage]
MKLTRQLLKQLISEEKGKLSEMCGDMSSQGHMVSMDPGSAVQHPSYAGSGDMSLPDNHDDHEGQMALSQLHQIMQNAGMLKGLVSEDDELQAWVQSKLTKASDYLNSVRNFLEYEMMPSQPVAIALQEGSLEFSKNQLKQIVAEELLNELGQSAIGQVGGQDVVYDPSQGQPSTEDMLRSSVMDAVDLLKQGNVEDALGQLQAVLDASTGGQGLDK